jgi:hypothetical protein
MRVIRCPSFLRHVETRGAEPLVSLGSLDDRGDDACTDGAAAFADGEAQLLFHRDRDDQLDLDGDVVARA